ncbi:hypothetical protein VTO73DRAFT_15538 [Trametes versicolor]
MAAPVDCLPTELLAEIISILHGDIPEQMENGFSARWIRATWVCRRWREAALQNCQLWTDLSTRRYVLHPEAIHAFLRRAPDAARVKVTVNAIARLGEDEEPIREDIGRADVLWYLQRWRDRMDLTLFFMAERNVEEDPGQADQHADINRLLGALGTALTSLWLGARNGGDPLHNRLILHAHRLPNLRKMVSNTVPYACDPLPCVTCIILYTVSLWGHGYLQEFLATSCPNVEDIVIHQWRTFEFQAAPAHLPLVYLERLTDLALTAASTESTSDVLALFRLGPSTSLELAPDDRDRDVVRRLLRHDAWLRESLFSGDLENLPVLSSTQLLQVKIRHLHDDLSIGPDESTRGDPLWLYLYGRAGPEAGDGPHWEVKSRLQDGEFVMRQNPRYLGRLLHGLPLIVQPGLVRQFALGFPDWLSAGIRRQSLWRELFGTFHALESLMLCGWEFIEAATRTLEADYTLLPLLKSLHVCISHPPARADADRAMMKWLAVRREMGLPLEMLELRVEKVMSPETAAFARRLMDAAKDAQPGLRIEWHYREICDVCVWELPNSASEADGTDEDPDAGAGDGWEWAASDEDSPSEPDDEADSGSDNDG